MSSQRLEDDLVTELRALYDSSLDQIATLSLTSLGQRPRPNPIAPQPNQVTCIYGLRAVNTGPWRDPPTLPESVVFCNGNNTRTVDIWQMEGLNDSIDHTFYHRTPLLFRRGDELNVEFQPRNVDEGATRDWQNNVMLLGRVVEALDNTVTGVEPLQEYGYFHIPKSRTREPDPEKVAHKLLLSYLSKEEKELWRNRKRLLVKSKLRPEFTYEIVPHNVHLLNELGEVIESYCLVSGEPGVPNSDIVLSKYLLLQSNEWKFLEIANKTVHRRPQLSLQARRESIDIGTIGLQGGIYAGFTPIDIRALEDAVTNFGIASALIDGIANDVGGLVVRDILPDRDINRRRRV